MRKIWTWKFGVQVVEEMMNLDLKLCARTQMVDHTLLWSLIQYLWGHHQCPNLVHFENWFLKAYYLTHYGPRRRDQLNMEHSF
jgi:hypothetical protein